MKTLKSPEDFLQSNYKFYNDISDRNNIQAYLRAQLEAVITDSLCLSV